MGDLDPELQKILSNAVQHWIDLLAMTLKEAGTKNFVEEAYLTLATLQGGLILAKCLSNSKVFESTLKQLLHRWATIA